MRPIRLFISSVQKEFEMERAALRDYLRGHALMRRFFEPFLFEEVPAADRRADEVYLREVEECDIYLGLFGNDYGLEDDEGKAGLAEPEFAVSDGFVITIRRNSERGTVEAAVEVAGEVAEGVGEAIGRAREYGRPTKERRAANVTNQTVTKPAINRPNVPEHACGRGTDLTRNACHGSPPPDFRWDDGPWVELPFTTVEETPPVTQPVAPPVEVLA